MPKKKEPTYVQDSARDPEDAWIFDSLVGFLRGPVWHVPVMSFIEQKSLSKYFFYIELKYISFQLICIKFDQIEALFCQFFLFLIGHHFCPLTNKNTKKIAKNKTSDFIQS